MFLQPREFSLEIGDQSKPSIFHYTLRGVSCYFSCYYHFTKIFLLTPFFFFLASGIYIYIFDCFGCKLSPIFLMHFVFLAEQPYDSIPNFSAADALRLTGIGRNEFIDIMNKCRSKVLDKCPYMLVDIDNVLFTSHCFYIFVYY